MSSSISESELAELMHLMHIIPHKRQPREVQRIAKLTKWVKFFVDYDDSVHEACCRLMKYSEHPPGCYIFKKGDPGDSFCIILKGRVGVLIPATKLSAPSILTPGKSHRDPGAISNSKRILSYTRNLFAVSMIQRGSLMMRGPPIVLQQPKLLYDVETEIEVSTLGAGSSFGELALLQDAPRSASIICKELTVLAVLSKDNFNVVLKEYEARKLNEKISFVRSIPAFSGWSKQAMSKLTYYLKERKYKRTNVIYQEGDIAGEVFIVLEGEFKLTKTCKLQRDVEKSVRNSLTQAQLQVVIKGPREMFGESEVLSDQPRLMNCVCISTTGRLWAIAKYDFVRRVQSSETWNFIYQRHETQKKWITERLDQLIDIEVMKTRPTIEAQKTPIHLTPVEVTSLTSNLKRYSNTVLDSPLLPRAKSLERLKLDSSPCRARSTTGSEWSRPMTLRGTHKMNLYLRKMKKQRATGSMF